ncbi:MAG TPA: hypothetical protein VMM13_13905 [Euzebya sp.]|nr:hypothetical protein [Euzebya sp.]
MIEVLVPLGLVVIGVWCLWWGVRTGAAALRTGTAVSDVTMHARRGRIEVTGTAQPVALGASPVRGLPCVHWNVRVARIVERAPSGNGARLETLVDVDATSSVPFVMHTDGGPVTIDAARSRTGSGHQVVHRDQASFEETMVLDGQTYRLPPAAYGSRQVSEAVVAPGQAVWVWGDIEHRPDGPAIVGTDADPLRIDLTPQTTRRQQVLAVAGGVGAVGLVALLAGLALLT